MSSITGTILSARGQKYADLDLAAGYTKRRGDLYDKIEHPQGLISLTNPEYFLMQDEMLDHIKTKILPSIIIASLTYYEGPFGSKRLREAMADFINTNFAPSSEVAPECISFVSGVTALNEVLALSLTEDGVGLLLGSPIYGSIAPDLQTKSNYELVYTSFGDVDQFSVQAIDRYEQALRQAESSGRRYSCEALEALMRFYNKHSIHLISNEVYALSVYYVDDTYLEFNSVLSTNPSGLIDPSSVHDLAAAGLRLGCLISRNVDLIKAARSLARFHCASPLSDAVAALILEDKRFYASFLKRSYMLNAAGIPLSPNPIEMSTGQTEAYHDELPSRFRLIFSVNR
ncbi:PLP-dependent transferase [Lentithecium fluviatile CBS 122367]|uniref:PLP-dependent transferase n=1 Tax=Lentithecium fluviatile CBS 122367 TaxID=1168545 RepID=A0A6G1JKL8_9PLEO|nr:PLP-dependent transferase [Lentithecium fluviatile CBS 122367]